MDNLDETEVKTSHKRHLEKIREKEEIHDDRAQGHRGPVETSERGIRTAQRPDQGTRGTDKGNVSEAGGREEGMESGARIIGGTGEGVRSSDAAGFSPIESTYPSYGEVGEGKLASPLTEAEKLERDRELARQRKQRQRDREKAEGYLSSNRDSDSDRAVTQPVAEQSRFQLKNPFDLKKEPEKVKLFSKTESDESEDAIVKVLMVGTDLLDDILEIIVKDHEPVSIWAMDEDEATLFAQAHLKRAQKDQDAARVARKLIAIHDKLLTFQYLFSRTKKTVSHVKEHGGLGFR